MTINCKIVAKLQSIKQVALILALALVNAAQAQVLQPLGLELPGKVVSSYASDNVYLALFDEVRTPVNFDYTLGKWNGLYWEYYPGLGAPESVTSINGDYNFHSIAIFKNEIYIAAYINNLAVGTDKPINHLYKWDGTKWITVLGSVASTNYGVYDMVVWNNKLIVAGKFLDTFSGMAVDNIAAYDGTTWTQLGANNSNQGTNGEILSIQPVGNRLYIAGNFTKFGGTNTGNIAYFSDNNNNWGGIGSPYSGSVNQLANVGNAIYALQTTGATAIVRKFENSVWSAPFNMPGYSVSNIKSIAGGNSELYIGGNFNYQGLVHNIAMYKNNTFYTTENRIEGDFKLAQQGNSAYLWGDFREINTDIKYFSTLRSNAGNASGIVFWDKNNNCQFDSEEEVVANAGLIYTDKNGKSQFVYTNQNGRFSAYLQPGLHNVTLNGGKNWKDLCPNSKQINAIAGSYSTSFYGLHIPINTVDMGVNTHVGTMNQINAGDEQKAIITITNNGATTINGATIAFNHDTRLQGFNSYPPASNYSDATATYTILNLKPRQSTNIEIYLTIPANATKAEKYKLQVNGGSLINSQDIDVSDNGADNWLTLNDKKDGNIYKTAVTGDTSLINNKIIKYTIEYANGTSEFIQRAVVIDTLDSDYQLEKINYTKHSPRIENFNVINGNIMVLDIPNAFLSTRENGPLESTGIIEFELVLSKSLKHRTMLTNSAMVDFDSKYKFYSNTTQVLVFDPNNSVYTPKIIQITLSPNPADQFITVQSKNNQSLGKVSIIDINGKIVATQACNADQTTVNISDIAAGTYLVQTNLGEQVIQIIH